MPRQSSVVFYCLTIMPTAAPKPCVKCQVLVYDGTTHCTKHKPLPWQFKKRTRHKRITGRKLQSERQKHFREKPFCVDCLSRGIYTYAEELDHIQSLGQEGTDTRDNKQGLCKRCHARKTAKESLVGRGYVVGQGGS